MQSLPERLRHCWLKWQRSRPTCNIETWAAIKSPRPSGLFSSPFIRVRNMYNELNVWIGTIDPLPLAPTRLSSSNPFPRLCLQIYSVLIHTRGPSMKNPWSVSTPSWTPCNSNSIRFCHSRRCGWLFTCGSVWLTDLTPTSPKSKCSSKAETLKRILRNYSSKGPLHCIVGDSG